MREGYKRTEVGEIPGDWEVRPLEAAGQWFSGSTPSMSRSEYWTGDIPWVSPKDMKVPRISDSIDHITAKAVVDGARLLPTGTILMVIRGMILAHSFPVARAECPLAVNQDIKAVVPDSSLNSYFLLYWLVSNKQRFRSLTTESTHGTKRLPSEMLMRELIACPTKAEQDAIANALSDADALIESLEQLLVKKRQVKRGAMQELLTGKRRLPGFEVKAGYKQTEVGLIPEDWDLAPMAELFSFQNGVNAPKSAYGSGVPFINVMEVIDHLKISKAEIPGKVRLSKEAIKTFEVQRGDLLFNRTSETQNEVGLASVYLGDDVVVFGGFVVRARPRDSGLDFIFMAYSLRSFLVRTQIIACGQGAVRANIGQKSLAQINVVLPTRAEQDAIANALSDLDAEITALEHKLKKARQLKQGMMQELLTGRIRLI